jgi:Flp pilus assembly protein TadG
MSSCKAAVQRGSVLVEAAMVLPLLWLLLAAIVQFGYTFAVLITMQNAALAAVRTATLGEGRTAAEVCEVARTAAASLVEPTALECVTSPTLPAASDSLVTVALSYPMPLFFYGELSMFGTGFNLETTAAMH